MRTEPFPPPRRDRAGRPRPDLEWADRVLDLWELAGSPPLDGPPLDQVLTAFAIIAGRARCYIPA